MPRDGPQWRADREVIGMAAQQAGSPSKHVAVLAGPDAAACGAALREAGYRVTEIAAGHELPATLDRLKPDAVFRTGRPDDGRIAGVLELLGIPYTHSGLLSTALAVDRHQAKIMFRAAGLPVTDHVVVARVEAAHAHQLPPPYVVKPVAVGSGPSPVVVRSEREMPPQQILEERWGGSEAVMIERFVPGRTLAVAVMGDVALAVSEVVTDQPSGEAPRIQVLTPAQISPNIYENLQKMSLKAHEVLGCRGVTRTSFRCNDQASGDSGVVLLELETQPDLSPAGVVAEQAGLAGHSLRDLVAWMVEDASCNR